MLFSSNRLVYFDSEIPNAFACGEVGQNVPKVDRKKFVALRKELNASDELTKDNEKAMLDRLEQAVNGGWRVDMSNDGKVRNCVTADTKLTSYLRDNIDVLFLQTLLKKAGYDPGKLDGLLGNETALAVYKFQKANGLRPDSIFGPLTFAKLKEVITGEKGAVVPAVDAAKQSALEEQARRVTEAREAARAEAQAPAAKVENAENAVMSKDAKETLVGNIESSTSDGYGKRIWYWTDIEYKNPPKIEGNKKIVIDAINNVFGKLTADQKEAYKNSDIRGIVVGGKSRGFYRAVGGGGKFLEIQITGDIEQKVLETTLEKALKDAGIIKAEAQAPAAPVPAVAPVVAPIAEEDDTSSLDQKGKDDLVNEIWAATSNGYGKHVSAWREDVAYPHVPKINQNKTIIIDAINEVFGHLTDAQKKAYADSYLYGLMVGEESRGLIKDNKNNSYIEVQCTGEIDKSTIKEVLLKGLKDAGVIKEEAPDAPSAPLKVDGAVPDAPSAPLKVDGAVPDAPSAPLKVPGAPAAEVVSDKKDLRSSATEALGRATLPAGVKFVLIDGVEYSDEYLKGISEIRHWVDLEEAFKSLTNDQKAPFLEGKLPIAIGKEGRLYGVDTGYREENGNKYAAINYSDGLAGMRSILEDAVSGYFSNLHPRVVSPEGLVPAVSPGKAPKNNPDGYENNPEFRPLKVKAMSLRSSMVDMPFHIDFDNPNWDESVHKGWVKPHAEFFDYSSGKYVELTQVGGGVSADIMDSWPKEGYVEFSETPLDLFKRGIISPDGKIKFKFSADLVGDMHRKDEDGGHKYDFVQEYNKQFNIYGLVNAELKELGGKYGIDLGLWDESSYHDEYLMKEVVPNIRNGNLKKALDSLSIGTLANLSNGMIDIRIARQSEPGLRSLLVPEEDGLVKPYGRLEFIAIDCDEKPEEIAKDIQGGVSDLGKKDEVLGRKLEVQDSFIKSFEKRVSVTQLEGIPVKISHNILYPKKYIDDMDDGLGSLAAAIAILKSESEALSPAKKDSSLDYFADLKNPYYLGLGSRPIEIRPPVVWAYGKRDNEGGLNYDLSFDWALYVDFRKTPEEIASDIKKAIDKYRVEHGMKASDGINGLASPLVKAPEAAPAGPKKLSEMSGEEMKQLIADGDRISRFFNSDANAERLEKIYGLKIFRASDKRTDPNIGQKSQEFLDAALEESKTKLVVLVLGDSATCPVCRNLDALLIGGAGTYHKDVSLRMIDEAMKPALHPDVEKVFKDFYKKHTGKDLERGYPVILMLKGGKVVSPGNESSFGFDNDSDKKEFGGYNQPLDKLDGRKLFRRIESLIVGDAPRQTPYMPPKRKAPPSARN